MLNSESVRESKDEPRRPQGEAPADASRPTTEKRVAAWIANSVAFKGQLTSLEDTTIDGRVEGTIDVRDHDLTIGPDATIQASITARVVTVQGSVTGTITATGKVDIRGTGAVKGDIISPRLAIADGAVFQGRADTGQAKKK